jgi:signal transduction histidine kinase
VSALERLAGAWLRQRSPTRRVVAWALAVAGPALLTLAALPLRSSLVLGGFLFSALLLVMASAVIGGLRPALAGVVLSVLARVFLFAPPFHERGADLQPNLVSLVGFVVAGTAVAILIGELAQLAEEQASSRRVEASMRRVATLVARGVPPEEVFAAVAREAGQLLPVDSASMCRFEPDHTLTLVAQWGSAASHFPVGSRWTLGGHNLGTLVFETGRQARIDGYADSSSGALGAVIRESALRSAVATPIIVQGHLWGLVAVGSSGDKPLPSDAEARLASFTELVDTAIANAEHLTELNASRARVVTAADETRRRIERDLHDGAQQRLVTLGLALRAAQAAVPPQFGELEGELASMAKDLAGVLEDLQEMARGIHPAILARGGLGPALKTLARRCALPVELDVRGPAQLPERVEVAVYYVVAEALTNAAKHAHATFVHVDVELADRLLHLRVRDDGRGGADQVRGTGLVGLKDRVEALGGTITVHSPVGAGTSLHAEFPLAD